MVRKRISGDPVIYYVDWNQMVDEQVQNSLKVDYFIGSQLSGTDGATGRIATLSNTFTAIVLVTVSGLVLNSTRYTASGNSITFNIPIDDATNDIVIVYLK